MTGGKSKFRILCAMLVNRVERNDSFKLKFEIQTEDDSNFNDSRSFAVKNFIQIDYSVKIKHEEGKQTPMKLNIYLLDDNMQLCSNQLDFSFGDDANRVILESVMLGEIEFKFLFSINFPSIHKYEFVSYTPKDIRYFEISQEDLNIIKKDGNYGDLIHFTENGRNYIIKMNYDNEKYLSQYFMIDHPNICRIAGYTSIDGKLGLVFDYTDLEPISNIKGILDFRKIMIEICSALSYLHSLGFVHLDLRTSNILVDHKGNIKISSFADNNLDDYLIHHIRRSGFMAPEIEFRSYDYLSDVYSAGLIACFIISMKKNDSHYHIESIFKKIKKGKLIKSLSCEDQAIIRAMIADDPKERPTFAEVIFVLNSANDQHTIIEFSLKPFYETGDDYLYYLSMRSNIGLFHCLMYHRLHDNKDKELEIAHHFQFPCDEFISYYLHYLALADDIQNNGVLVNEYMNLDKNDYHFYLMPPPDMKRYEKSLDDSHFPVGEQSYQIGQIYPQSSDIREINRFISVDDKIAKKRRELLNRNKKKEKQEYDILIEEDTVKKINKSNETVSIPPNVKYIGEKACMRGKIVSLDLQNTQIITICSSSFSSCDDLRFVSLPSSLEVIENFAFYYCELLEKVTIPTDSKLYKICNDAFEHCKKLEGFDFPHLLKYVGEDAFKGCKLLKVVDLRETDITQIGTGAFRSKIIKVVMLPAKVSTSCIINCCDAALIVDKDHKHVKSDDCGNIYLYKTLIQFNKKSKHALIRRGIEIISTKCFHKSIIVSLTFPASVVLISEFAFEKCERLKRISFSKNSRLLEIQRSAFVYCTSLNNIHFPKSLQKIMNFAFDHCNSLENVYFHQEMQLEEIDQLFFGTKIKQLSIPPSVRRIGNICSGTNQLRSITLNNDLFETFNNGSMILSKDGRELICVANNAESFKIPESVRVIKKGAFYFTKIEGCYVIPATIEVIEDDAFYCCTSLKRLKFEEGSRLKFFGKNGDLNKAKHLIKAPK